MLVFFHILLPSLLRHLSSISCSSHFYFCLSTTISLYFFSLFFLYLSLLSISLCSLSFCSLFSSIGPNLHSNYPCTLSLSLFFLSGWMACEIEPIESDMNWKSSSGYLLAVRTAWDGHSDLRNICQPCHLISSKHMLGINEWSSRCNKHWCQSNISKIAQLIFIHWTTRTRSNSPNC